MERLGRIAERLGNWWNNDGRTAWRARVIARFLGPLRSLWSLWSRRSLWSLWSRRFRRSLWSLWSRRSFWFFWFFLLIMGFGFLILFIIPLYVVSYFPIDRDFPYDFYDNSSIGPNAEIVSIQILGSLFIVLNVANHYRSTVINISSALTGEGDRDEEILSKCQNVIKSTEDYGIIVIVLGLTLIVIYFFWRNVVPDAIEFLHWGRYAVPSATRNIEYFLAAVRIILGLYLIVPIVSNHLRTSAICQTFIATRPLNIKDPQVD